MRKSHVYWDEGVTLVSSCTRCSPGCNNCWALAMEQRFKPEFKNQIQCHPERLKRFNTRKPKVFSIWNDFWHESITDDFQYYAIEKMVEPNTYLILTKRPHIVLDFYKQEKQQPYENIWHGLTVCNQEEADEKIPIFLQVPGKKFLSIEPCLSQINIEMALEEFQPLNPDLSRKPAPIQVVILGGETGPGARPMKLEWASKIADQCKAAGVPLFIKALTINGKPNHNIEDWPEELRIRELAW